MGERWHYYFQWLIQVTKVKMNAKFNHLISIKYLMRHFMYVNLNNTIYNNEAKGKTYRLSQSWAGLIFKCKYAKTLFVYSLCIVIAIFDFDKDAVILQPYLYFFLLSFETRRRGKLQNGWTLAHLNIQVNSNVRFSST